LIPFPFPFFIFFRTFRFVAEDGDSRTDGDNPMPAGHTSITSGESPFGKSVTALFHFPFPFPPFSPFRRLPFPSHSTSSLVVSDTKETSPSRGLVTNPETPEPGPAAKDGHDSTSAATTAAALTPEAGHAAAAPAAAAPAAATTTTASAAAATTTTATHAAEASSSSADASFQCALCTGFTEKFKVLTQLERWVDIYLSSRPPFLFFFYYIYLFSFLTMSHLASLPRLLVLFFSFLFFLILY
jgi:hypothetical protein